MTDVTLPTGEQLPVPGELADAIDRAVQETRAIAEAGAYGDWRTAFGRALTAALFDSGLLLVPRAFERSSNAVNTNVYSLARETQHRAERRLHAARDAFRGDACRGDLQAEFEAAVRALTGHAPLPGVGRVAGVDERLRALRLALLDIPLDQPTAELLAPNEGDAA